jgi:uncharacterized protein (DUF2249 family)
MTHACSCGHEAATIDVRELAPRARHPRIFATFDALPAGHAFIILGDHDPKALFLQFQADRAAAFGWRYLEEGPELWRVEIWKRPALVHRAQTVAEIARDPRALDVLKRSGIQDGASHLTLAEAATAAGVSLGGLLDALEGAMAGPSA